MELIKGTFRIVLEPKTTIKDNAMGMEITNVNEVPTEYILHIKKLVGE
jgi:hypothetical protein